MNGAGTQVYLNGEFLPLEQARVSVMDRGFLFGDGVYEVIPAYGGKPFRLEEHLARLDNSLAEIRMGPPLDHAGWTVILGRLTAQFPGRDQSLYLQVTRGPADERNHVIPATVTPTLFAMTSLLTPPPADIEARGIAAITLDDIRWRLCHIKAITLLANVLLKEDARERGATEAILVRDGFATEGAASNLFLVEGESIATPPKSRHLLPGITRDLVLELARDGGLTCREEAIAADRLAGADEIWMTSSTREIMPVVLLDGKRVGNGVPGRMFRAIDSLYARYKQGIRAS